MKTRSRQREDTGLTRLQSHSSSFEALSFTIDDFQWFNNGRTSPVARGGPARGSSRARRYCSPRTKGRAQGPSSFGREEASAARPGERERAGQRPPGPAATRRLRTAGREQNSGEEPRGSSSAVFTGSACAGWARAGPQHRDRAPAPAGAMGGGSV